MNVGIIGSNERAVAIGRLLVTGRHDVTIADSANPQRAQNAARELGCAAETPYRQGITRDLIFFAMSENEIDRALTALGSGYHATIVDAIDGRGNPDGASLLAKKLNTHNFVRALIVLPQAGANVPICGDDEHSKEIVDEALRACGCVTTDRGPLNAAAELEPQATATVTRGEVEARPRIAS